jgi:hypothetical protein
MGVESTAILVRWILEPDTRPCHFSELTVIVSQTGDEYLNTKHDVEQFLFPLMRKHNIRLVQVARHGPKEADGITVLSDTIQPTRLYIEGDYKLSDELRAAGTVPSFAGGVHRCSLKSKAFVIETWLASEFERTSFQGVVHHAFGYNSEEIRRVRKSEDAIAVRHVAFGFNADEAKRVERARTYDTAVRVGFYPLVEWGWNREKCIQYLQETLGVRWRRSSCFYCPFLRWDKEAAERHMEHADQVADALILERISLAMNPRGTLYRDRTLMELSIEYGNERALAIFEERMQQRKFAVYRVRRIYNAASTKDGGINPGKKGTVQRCVESLTGPLPRSEAESRWSQECAQGGTVRTLRGISYLYREECAGTFPTREDFLVVAPADVENKARYGQEWFDELWESRQQSLFPILAA